MFTSVQNSEQFSQLQWAPNEIGSGLQFVISTMAESEVRITKYCHFYYQGSMFSLYGLFILPSIKR